MKTVLRFISIALGGIVAAVLLLVVLKPGSTAPPTSILEPPVAGPHLADEAAVGGVPGVTLPELVYFGAAWQLLNKTVGMPPIALGNGYTNARVERTKDKLFFAGTVDKLDRQGEVTDVVLAFAGAQGIGDLIQGEALAHDRVLAEPRWAAMLFERIWNDPRYRTARIHVTGHSLGAGYAEFVATEAVARHGIGAVRSRVTVVAFGVPNWGPQSARYFHVGPHVLDGIFTGYTALNDPVITNGGTARVGTIHVLPPFTALSGWRSMFNTVAAHWPTAYMAAFGLPGWLTAEQKAACIRTVSGQFIVAGSYDRNYGARVLSRRRT